MKIDVYRDHDDSVYLVFAEGDAGIIRFRDTGWYDADEVPASAVLQADECNRDHVDHDGWSS